MPTDAAISAFKSSLRGELTSAVRPRLPRRPQALQRDDRQEAPLIAQVADVADVITAVNFAREQKMLVAIRSGGHNAGGLGVWTTAW